MTVPTWQPGTTYVPGALVVPRTAASVAVSALDNPSFDLGNTGWTLDAALTIQNGGGYDGPWCLTFVADAPNGANATNNAVFATSPGQSFTVTCMGRHDTGDDHSSDVGIAVDWYDKNNALITSTGGGGLPRLSQSGYQQVSLPVVAPAGAATFKVRLAPYRKSADNVQVDHVQLIGYAPPVSPRAVMYEATQPSPGKSGSTEPIWPPLGSSVTDGQVVWNGVNIDRIVWQASPLLESGATEPNWPTDPGGVVHDGTVDWVAYAPNITDANCPNTAVVAIMASKVFAVDKDIVRFCATANALDWTSPQDAGYLPTGLQQSNSNDMAVLAPYRGNLCAFNASCFQNWQVDPDPAAMALLDQMEGIGSVWPLAAHPVGNELYYLAALGVRSVSIAAGSDNLQAGDIGTPIDSLVQAALAALPAGAVPRSMYYPGAGQYWLAFPGAFEITGHLPDSPVGASGTYSYTALGDKGADVFTITGGALPPGATMSTRGVVTYDFTTIGYYAWTVEVTDPFGNVSTLDDACVIGPLCVAAVGGLTRFSGDDFATLQPSSADGVGTWVVWAKDHFVSMTSGAGAIVSSPNGTSGSWTPCSPLAAGANNYGLAWTGTALLATDNNTGIYRSTDNGATWTKVFASVNTMYQGFIFAVQGMAICRRSGGAATLQSLDDGATWTSVGANLSPCGLVKWRGAFYVAEESGGLYTYDPIANAWKAVSATIPGSFMRSIAVYGDVLYIAKYASNVYSTTDLVNFTNLGATTSLSPALYVDPVGNVYMSDAGIKKLVSGTFVMQNAAVTPSSIAVAGAGVDAGAGAGTGTASATTPVFVFTMNAGKGKWSRYTFPFTVDAFAQLGNDCYIRHGNVVSKLDESAVADEVNGTPVNFEGIVQWGWLDCGPPGATKMLESFDIVASGNPSVSIGYDQTDPTSFTTPYAVGPDTVPGTPIPLPMAAPSFSPKVTFPGGKQWTLQSMTLYLTDTPGQP